MDVSLFTHDHDAFGLEAGSDKSRRPEQAWSRLREFDFTQQGARRRARVPKQVVADMTSQLAIMLRSGVDLSTALSSLAAQCERPALARVMAEVQEAVLSGQRFSDALRPHPGVFDAGFAATVAAAEASGRMAEILAQQAAMMRGEVRLSRTIKGLLTYPVLLVVVSLTVISALVAFVLPRFAQVFEQYQMPLPVMTSVLIGVAAELRLRWWLWAPVVGVLVALLGLTVWSERGRRAFDHAVVSWSPFRQVGRPLLTGRFCRLMALMLQSGVPILEGLQLARSSMKNRLFQEMMADMSEAVVNGKSLSTALEGVDIMPESAREMISTAERTGNLAEVAVLLGDYYEEDAESRLRQLVRILEPAITVVMGLVIAVVVLSVMLPIFDLSSFVGGAGIR